MKYIYDFDFCALLVCALISVAYISRRRFGIVNSTFFRFFHAIVAISAAFDLLTSHLTFSLISVSSTPLKWIISGTGIVLMCFSCLLMTLYCFVLTNPDRSHINRRLSLTFITPIAVVLFFVILSPLTHWLYYIDGSGDYTRGPLFFIVHTVIMIYFIICAGLVHIYRKQLSRLTRSIITLFIVFSLLAYAIQLIFPHILTEIFALSMVVVILFNTIQSPRDVFDQSTGAYSRQLFISRSAACIDRNESWSVVFVHLEDLDDMPKHYGSTLSRNILYTVSEQLSSISSCRVYSIEPEIYAILIPEKDDPDASSKVINAIRNRFMSVWTVGNAISLRLSVRFFLIKLPSEDITGPEDLILYADNLQKEGTWNTDIKTVDDVRIGNHTRQDAVLKAVKKAISDQSFKVYFQPIYSTKDRQFTSAEALIRLIDSDLGFIPPDEFIPIAEENGCIIDIGTFVFDNVCRFIHDNRLADSGVRYVEINLSVVQCMQEDLTEQLDAIMKNYDIDPTMINLEITETAAMELPAVVQHNIMQLTGRGITFSMDDFGTGYANVLTLINLPFNIIKLDKSIIWSAFETKKGRTALRSSMSMIKDMNLKSVAEGIETEEMADELTDMGCSYLQGYYFSRPVPGDEYLAFLKDHNTVSTASEKEMV